MSSTNGKNRVDNDVYPTPRELVTAFLDHLWYWNYETFLEPCRACGSIYDQVELPGTQKYWAELREGVDYLETPFKPVDLIITNPPFKLAEQFINKSLSELKPGGLCAYLLRGNFMGGVDRHDNFWGMKVPWPQKLIFTTPRPDFTGSGGDSCEYAWFCWGDMGRLDISEPISSLKWDKPRKVPKRKAKQSA